MSQPVVGLILVFLSLGVAVFLFWPGFGVVDRWRRLQHLSTRILIEDALKYCYKAQVDRLPVSANEMAGVLQVSPERASQLIHTMLDRRLLQWQQERPVLTREGEEYALHIVRAHRLWERHLAEQTGYVEQDWHGMAEVREHHLTAEEVDRLSATLGHPTHDPHGDPIPTRAGQIVPHEGRPLMTLAAGQAFRIVHIEDEPASTYARLAAEGLRPGLVGRIEEQTPEGIRFRIDGDVHVLSPLTAQNVSIISMPELAAEAAHRYEKLTELTPGQSGVVRRLSSTCRGVERRRLLDLGLTPGTVVKAEYQGRGAQSTAYRIRGALIALRREQADRILITKEAGVPA